MAHDGDSYLGIVGDSNSMITRSGEPQGLNAQDAYGSSSPSMLSKIWNHVSNNFHDVMSGNGTVLQDLEFLGEGALVGAAAGLAIAPAFVAVEAAFGAETLLTLGEVATAATAGTVTGGALAGLFCTGLVEAAG